MAERVRASTERLSRQLPDAGRQALEDFLAEASAQGERIVSATRLVLCGLALLRLLILVPHELAAGSTKYWTATTAILVGALVSVVWLLRHEPRVSPLRLHVSVVLDVVTLTVVLTPMVLWPHAGYAGFLREPEAAAYLLVVLAGAARLSLSAALVGCALNAAALVMILALDVTLQAHAVTYQPGDVALAAILFLSAAVFACAGSRGIRSLVFRGAHAYALAARAAQRLGVYVSEEVAREVLASDDDLQLGGRREDVAVLFSDLRGFTRYSESLEPEALVAELNAYFEAMLTALRREGGTIDKFIGDAIMAVFHGPQAASAAIRGGVAMHDALVAHNALRETRGLPPLRQGVGIHYGSVVTGNIGSRERMQHTVIGDTVNVASRLESATKEEGVSLIVSGPCVARAREEPGDVPTLQPRGELRVRGRAEPLEIFVALSRSRTSPEPEPT